VQAERSGVSIPRYAAIDIGSNTVKLTIAERDPTGRLVSVLDAGFTTRIGECIERRRLGEEPIRRTLDALERCLSACAEHEVERVYAVGTSAIRDAENREEFLQRARAIGATVEVLSGDDEARLSALAVRSDPRWRDAPRLAIIDIGGGSTEVICDVSNEPGDCGRVSLQLGAVRLTEACIRSDPPTASELNAARHAADDALADIVCDRPAESATAVGVGGTVTNLGSVNQALRGVANPDLHGLKLPLAEVTRQIELFATMPLDQRRRTPGLDPARADVITAGAIILERTLTHLNLDVVYVSCRGLRWGVLHERHGA